MSKNPFEALDDGSGDEAPIAAKTDNRGGKKADKVDKNVLPTKKALIGGGNAPKAARGRTFERHSGTGRK